MDILDKFHQWAYLNTLCCFAIRSTESLQQYHLLIQAGSCNICTTAVTIATAVRSESSNRQAHAWRQHRERFLL
eukprot:666889-Pelagomonas_calceolata.AAC.2